MCQSENKTGKFTGEWFCLGCQTVADPQTVTFDEMHEVCGGAVVWRTSAVIGEAEAVIRVDDKPDRAWMAKRIKELEQENLKLRNENIRLKDRLAYFPG